MYVRAAYSDHREPAVPPTAQPPPQPSLSPADQLISQFDRTLKTLFGVHASHRPNPAGDTPDTVTGTADRRHIAGLMRVNHAGEIAAQALYHGQALTARQAATRDSMTAAAQDETDHLAWCEQRLTELGSRRSLLDPVWYAGSFAIGALAGLAGDKASLGFVAETERQVVKHLESHLQELPSEDARTRKIIEQMRTDEARHGYDAEAAGGMPLPLPIRKLMNFTSRIMTRTAYWI
jgi:ubiquinone biosynthesis monooxygenase Coq7